MKENAYLLICRNAICEAIKRIETINSYEARIDLIFALAVLDAFRHGQLQKCDNCADIKEEVKGP